MKRPNLYKFGVVVICFNLGLLIGCIGGIFNNPALINGSKGFLLVYFDCLFGISLLFTLLLRKEK